MSYDTEGELALQAAIAAEGEAASTRSTGPPPACRTQARRARDSDSGCSGLAGRVACGGGGGGGHGGGGGGGRAVAG